MVEKRGVYRVLVGRPDKKGQLGDLGADGRIILEWVSKTWCGEAWAGLNRLRIGTRGGLL
jgi:hypothetical protein